MINLTCSKCGQVFLKEQKEYNRRLRHGSKNFYCSRKCSNIVNSKNLGKYLGKGNSKYLNVRKEDEYSPFRYFMKNIRRRHIKSSFGLTDITPEFLKELWEKQQGICPITGWKLILPNNTSGFEQNPVNPKQASLDRIVPKLPYMKDNVRFIAFIANMCKSTFKDEDVVGFCKAVAKYN